MVTKVLRKIIQIDAERCNGCGVCITSCAEGALALVDGKAKLVRDQYCDGLAACLKECPQGALKIVEREAENFDEQATEEHLKEKKRESRATPCACPGSLVRQLEKSTENSELHNVIRQESELTHWPVQMALVPPGAVFLNQADVVLIADCVAVACPNLHQDFIKDHAVLIACPKLDDYEAHVAKLTEILKKSEIKSLTIVHMEVPCCSGLTFIARQAIKESGREIPFQEVIIGIKGCVKE